jgi:hypothetical protein
MQKRNLKTSEHAPEGQQLKGTVARKSWRDECMGH